MEALEAKPPEEDETIITADRTAGDAGEKAQVWPFLWQANKQCRLQLAPNTSQSPVQVELEARFKFLRFGGKYLLWLFWCWGFLYFVSFLIFVRVGLFKKEEVVPLEAFLKMGCFVLHFVCFLLDRHYLVDFWKTQYFRTPLGPAWMVHFAGYWDYHLID